MKNIVLSLMALLLVSANLFAQDHPAQADSDEKCLVIRPRIIIPETICFGECVLVRISPSNAASPNTVFTVATPGGTLLSTHTGETFLFCGNLALGSYIITAELNSDFTLGPFPEQVTVTDFYIPSITSSSINNCIANETGEITGNNCQQVCAGATVVYTADDSQGLDLIWEVDGADDLQINGSTATVTWGSEGYGQINVSVAEPTEILHVECQPLLLPSDNTIEDGEAIVFIVGGTAPYNIQLTLANGQSFERTGTLGANIFTEVPVGEITVTVISADGQQSDCLLVIETASSPGGNLCNNLPFVSISSMLIGGSISGPVECLFECTAEILGGTPPYIYQWSNGETTATTLWVSGTASVTITDSNGCTAMATSSNDCNPTCTGENEICIEILPTVEAAFSSSIPIVDNMVEICRGQPLSFFNESENASSYYWSFTPQEGSSALNPEYVYEQAGTYELSLVASNDCFCRDTTTLSVIVSDAEVPAISCQGTICEGDVGTYSTPDNCSTYEWNVSNNGLILDGGGLLDTFVQVEWLAGQMGNVSLATPGCSSSTCPLPNTITIPIVGGGAVISGPTEICPFERVEFRVPNYSGTTIFWDISPGGVINGNSNEAQVNAYWETGQASDSLWIAVTYDNCQLECGGTDTLRLSLLPKFHLVGDIENCENAPIQFAAFASNDLIEVTCNWRIEDDNGQALWESITPSHTIDEILGLAAGNYWVVATPATSGLYCLPFVRLPLRLRAAPTPLSAINGPTNICPGSSYTYSADINSGDYRFRWYIQNGSNASEQEGTSALVSWGDNAPYELSLTRIPLNGLACESAPLSINLTAIPNLNIAGDAMVCVDQIGNYNVTTNSNDEITWRVEPSGSGSIVPTSNSGVIEVYWNSAGNAQVIANGCGLEESLAVTVATSPMLEVVHPVAICPGTTVMVSTSTTYVSYNWYNNQGQLLSSEPNPILGAGTYSLAVMNNEGCSASTGFSIDEWSAPTAHISTGSYPAFCPGGASVEILALAETEAYQYRWFRDGLLLTEMSASFMANQTGSYWVEITDQNACTATSNTINILSCGDLGGNCIGGFCLPAGSGPPIPPSGGQCIVDGTPDFVHTPMTCDEILFTNLFTGFLAGTLTWNFGDPASGANNSSNIQNPIHIFSLPGVYTVQLSGEINSTLPGQNCTLLMFDDVRVPARAQFDYLTACANEAVSFIDRSIFLPDETITDWSWDFDDPASGNNSAVGPTADHLFSSPGTYEVELTISLASGCSSTFSQQVEVTTVASGGMQLPAGTCAESALNFQVASPVNGFSYQWTFLNAAEITIGTAMGTSVWQTFPVAANYTIRLTTIAPFGCETTEEQSFSTSPNNLSGDISVQPTTQVCSGDSIILQAPAGGTIWQWQDGSTASQAIFYSNTVAQLTISDAAGCRYIPSSVVLEFVEPPYATIQSVEYDEYGQTIQIYDQARAICAGEGIFFLSQENENYSYLWSNGDTENGTGFYDERDTLLPEGVHIIDLQIIDNQSGCSFTTPPFQVTVHPTPDRPSTSGIYPLCEDELSTLYVQNAADSLSYGWTDGQMGDTIQVVAGGAYSAYAQNEFGCQSTPSYRTLVLERPNLDLFPRGCFSVCRPDTLCVPFISGVNRYQWYHEGELVPAPEGTQRNLIVEEEGAYWLEVRSGSGSAACFFTSPEMEIEFENGYGELMGGVYFDINNNGIIDPLDSLGNSQGINVFDEQGSLVHQTSTGGDSRYLIDSVLSDELYVVSLDTTGLGDNWSVDSVSYIRTLAGCGDMASVNWLLLRNCEEVLSILEEEICPGEQVFVAGDFYEVGDSSLIRIARPNTCDSLILLTVDGLRTEEDLLEVEVCEGSWYDHFGTIILPDEVQVFNYTNAVGCDSTLRIITTGLETAETLDTLYSCPEVAIEYGGLTLLPGMLQAYSLMGANGCDSTAWIRVEAYASQRDSVDLWACPGETITYAGSEIIAGESQLLGFQNNFGCDSSILVNTYVYPTQEDTLRPLVCLGESYLHEGVSIAIGEENSFTYSNQYGCDSILTIIVESYESIGALAWEVNESCGDAATGSLQLIGPAPNGLSFSLDELNWQATTTFSALRAGEYELFVRDEESCQTSQLLIVPEVPALELSIDELLLPCASNGVVVSPSVNFPADALSWQWPDGSTETWWRVTTAGDYSLSIANDCEALNQNFQANWDTDLPADFFYWPNVFSPNQDGLHDSWLPLAVEGLVISSYQLQIFDRWGGLVYETTDSNSGWNGQAQGKVADPGVFVVMVEASFTYCGQQRDWQMSRDVLLLR